jgi:threonyl-tRNA synthetase
MNSIVGYAVARFYYDFEIPDCQLSSSDLKKIKKEMDKIIKRNVAFRCETVSFEDARYCLQVGQLMLPFDAVPLCL